MSRIPLEYFGVPGPTLIVLFLQKILSINYNHATDASQKYFTEQTLYFVVTAITGHAVELFPQFIGYFLIFSFDFLPIFNVAFIQMVRTHQKTAFNICYLRSPSEGNFFINLYLVSIFFVVAFCFCFCFLDILFSSHFSRS